MHDWVKDRWLAKDPGPHKVGDHVRFRFGITDVEGVIVEDWGNLAGGKRLYSIKFHFGEGPEKCVDLAPDEFHVIAAAPKGGDNGKAK